MQSIWTNSVSIPAFSSLETSITADVAVIGGGLAGILTAALLQQRGVDVVVLEADRIGSGQTAGTTAKLTAQHGLKYHQLAHDLGINTAAAYAKINQQAAEHLQQLIHKRDISCELKTCTAFLYSTAPSISLQEEYDTCRELDMDVFLTQDTELPFPAQALGLRNQAHFHPLKLIAELSKSLQIFEQSRVLRVEGYQVETEKGSVDAQTVIFTCHFPFINVPGYYFARQHQERSCVLALENAMALQDYYLGIDNNGLSFRPYGQYLLLGGSGYRTGENRQGGQYERLLQAAQRYWPNFRVASSWSAQDCMPMDGIPYIGQYAKNRPNWLVATGFQKWGMSSSMAAAEILSAMACGETPPAGAEIFSPHRFHVSASAKQLADDVMHSVRNLGHRLLEPGRIPAEQLPIGHGGIVELDGEKLAVYHDESGKLFAVSAVCPHLGCQLEWNPDEKSWDCPCHGSRFDIYGHLLNGPAQKDL